MQANLPATTPASLSSGLQARYIEPRGTQPAYVELLAGGMPYRRVVVADRNDAKLIAKINGATPINFKP